MNNETDVLVWAHRQVVLIAKKFSARGDNAIYFNDFQHMEVGKGYAIPEPKSSTGGGIMTLIQRTKKEMVIDYQFAKGSILEIHHHPDFIENFEIHSGSMIDEVHNVIRSKGDRFEILPFVPHQWRCLEDSKMVIRCSRI